MSVNYSNSKIGVYVDVANVNRNGGYGMHYDVLRQFACRDGAEAIRLNAYASFDPERSREDGGYRKGINAYFSVLREYGFKVIQKKVKWYQDEKGNRFGKANSDLDMAVDALMQSRYLDRVLLVTGDGDFVQVVRALQNFGCRVEVASFDNVSLELKREADLYLSGYLIPNLLPIKRPDHREWGQIGSYARGYCYHYDEDKGFGFIRYLKNISPGLWITDSRNEESPYSSLFFHSSQLPREFNGAQLPSREIIFEFKIDKSRNEQNKEPIATNLRLISSQYTSNPFYRKDHFRDTVEEEPENYEYDTGLESEAMPERDLFSYDAMATTGVPSAPEVAEETAPDESVAASEDEPVESALAGENANESEKTVSTEAI